MTFVTINGRPGFALFVVGCILLVTSPLSATIRPVYPDGSGSYATIQDAIDACQFGDEVVLADGTYTGTGNKNLDFNGKMITVHSESGDPSLCILDCEGDGRGFYFHSGESFKSVVAGLTITNGYVHGDSIGDDYGGAVNCLSSSPVFIGCTIRGNASAYRGGGVFCFNSSPGFTDCTISQNVSVAEGGGIGCDQGSSPSIYQCTILGNRTSSSGGGIWCNNGSEPMIDDSTVRDNRAYTGAGVYCGDSCDVTLTNILIDNNTADMIGGGIYCTHASPDITNSIVARNHSTDAGAGIYLDQYCDPYITNCTISRNESLLYGGGVFCYYSFPSIRNTILWGDSPDEIFVMSGDPEVEYCIVEGGWSGTGNLDQDPYFAFPYDYHQMPGSPAIDAGTNTPAGGLPSLDFDGNTRMIDGDGNSSVIVDIGAYESDPYMSCIALTPDRLVFTAPEGGENPDDQILSLRNCGPGTLDWSISNKPAWITVVPDYGYSSGEVDTVQVSADISGLGYGVYEGELEIVDAKATNSPRHVTIALYVTGTLHVPSEYPTIQAAIDAAYPGDVVKIDDGTYTGAGNKELDFHGKAITVRSASDDPKTCIIDCESDGRGFNFHNNEGHDSVVEGLTVMNGFTYDGGGGFNCDQSSPSIINCRIINNESIVESPGGGLYCRLSNARLIDCVIAGNDATQGGGLYCTDGAPEMANCLIAGNTAGNWGGGIVSWGSSMTLSNCTLSGNIATEGGGIYTLGGALTLSNCILWGDADDEIATSTAEFSVNYCCIQRGWGGGGIGNIASNPDFSSPNGPDGDPYTWEDNDYRLTVTSPCIDAADNEALPEDEYDFDGDGDTSEPLPYDLDGSVRFWDIVDTPDTGFGVAPIVDMGAYEFRMDVYVDAGATGNGNGSSWANAIPDLQVALDLVAQSNETITTIRVAGGTYRPTAQTHPGDPRSATFQLMNNLTIRGGYAGSNDPYAPDTRDIDTYPTVLNGDIGTIGTAGDNSYHVVTATGTDNSAVLDGFILSEGVADGTVASGAGFLTQGGGARLVDCTITGNNGSCGSGLYSRGAAFDVDGLILGLNGSGGDYQSGISGSTVQVSSGGLRVEAQTVAVYNSVFDTDTGDGYLYLEPGASMTITAAPVCQTEPISLIEGTMIVTPIYTKLLEQWYVNGALFTDVVIKGSGGTLWSIAPGFSPSPAIFRWVGNPLWRDLSDPVTGQAEAMFGPGGRLTIYGPLYNGVSDGATLLHDGLLLDAWVGSFQIRETTPDSNKFEFVSDGMMESTPQVIPIGGYLYENSMDVSLSGIQILSAAFGQGQQSGGPIQDFWSDITLSGNSIITLSPLNPTDGMTELRCGLTGLGDVQIDPGATLLVSDGAVVDLSGDMAAGCADPAESENWGTITVHGELLVRDATIQNSNVEVTLADIDGAVDIINNDITMLESSIGFGGQFFVEGTSLIRCNYITSYGDRYLDLDPDPSVPPEQRPTFEDNVINVIITQGVEGDQGTLLELRALDYDEGSQDCNGNVIDGSGAYCLPASAGYDDAWTLERLEVMPGAKVNLTNRQGFEFNGQEMEDTLYVRTLKLHPGAILNAGLQRMYYQELVDENDHPLTRDPVDPDAPMSNGSQIVDIPLLGFSLVVIAMDDTTPPPHNEFDVRVRRRITDPNDIQPFEPPFYQGAIARMDVDDPANPGEMIGIMEMKTRDDDQLPASSVAAKGAFARAGDEYITVTFDYLWQGEGELYVYMSDYPDVSECAAPDDFGTCHRLMAVLTPPEPGHPGAIGSDQFALFRGRFPSSELNFTRGTYIELELRGPDANIWIDNWDPQIECHSIYCADLNKSASVDEVDFCLLAASLGESFDDNDEEHWCLDNGLSNYDGYVDYLDLLGWDAFLADSDNPSFSHLCNNPIEDYSKAATPKGSIPAGTFDGNLVMAGKSSATQDDSLLVVPPSAITCTADGVTQMDSLQVDQYVPQCASCTRGNGVLAKNMASEVFQVHGLHGIVRSEDGQVVVPPAVFPAVGTNGVVCVGVVGDNPSGLPGLPLMDLAIDPAEPASLYVAPVLMVPDNPDRCPYAAAAKLTLLDPDTGSYTLTQLYSGMAGRTRYSSECDPIMSHPNPQNQREIEVDGEGSVYVLSASYGYHDYLLVYDEATGALSHKVYLSDLVRSPSAMGVDADGGYLYLTSSLGSTDESPGYVNVLLETFGITPGNPAADVTYVGSETIMLPTSHSSEQGYPFRGVVTSVEVTDKGDRYVSGMVLPVYPSNQTFTNQVPLFMSPSLAYLPVGQAGPFTAVAVEVFDLSLPLSVVLVEGGAAGDLDGDGDVDLDDYAIFAACLAGSGVSTPPAECTPDEFAASDLDGDSDVDLQDFGAFQELFDTSG